MAAILLGAATLAGCSEDSTDTQSAPAGDQQSDTATSSEESGTEQGASGQKFPDIVDVEVTGDGGTYTVAATVSSPYDSPERYADAFRVKSTDGEVFGVRELTHEHSTEQPFTRSLTDVELPSEIGSVIVEGRDQDNGWGGKTQTVEVPA